MTNSNSIKTKLMIPVELAANAFDHMKNAPLNTINPGQIDVAEGTAQRNLQGNELLQECRKRLPHPRFQQTMARTRS
jgi:hypothetical protein